MKITVEPGFIHTRKEPRYFVLSLDESDPSYLEGFRYEVQLLNDDGEGAAVVLLTEEDTNISVPGYDLPSRVVDAARRQEKGSGDYVNTVGESVRPF